MTEPDVTIDEPDLELLAVDLDELMVAVAEKDPEVTLVDAPDENAEHGLNPPGESD